MTDLFDIEPAVARSASISPCGLYRWSLVRCWNGNLPPVGWVMLNPSTADALADDPTIRRCIGFARGWGYGGIQVANLFALRATDPRELLKVTDPIGVENDKAIRDLCACGVVVAAWGVHGEINGRSRHVARLFRDAGIVLKCLGTTKDGHPRHPLYVPGDTALINLE